MSTTRYDDIANLVRQALDDPEIAQEPELVTQLTHIGDAALHQRRYYDDRNAFAPLVSSFARHHHDQILPVLLTLLRFVQTPHAYSGL